MGVLLSLPTYSIPSLCVAIFIVRFMIRKSRSSNRPALTSFLDTACELFSLLRIGPWAKTPDIHTAMEQAMGETKLTDWGANTDYNFVKRYDLVRTVGLRKSGGRYSPIGEYYMLQALTKRMVCRLEFVDYIKKHPAITKIDIKPPIFVVGFTRTGTTFLHEMLGLNESVRMHYTWEQMAPTPECGAAEDLPTLKKDREHRYKKHKSHFDLMFNHIVSQNIQSIHRIGYDEPEECTTPCSIELPWAVTELPFNTFAIDEIAEFGAGEAFTYYRKFLQMMTWQAEDRRDADFTWNLKCPFHLPYLQELYNEFPNATIVWTHRDPADCIASALSLYETLMCMSMEQHTVDKIKLGRAVMHYTKRSLEMAEKTINQLGDKLHILHVRYADTVKTPKETCRRVYERAGLPFSDSYSSRLDDYLKKSNEQRKKMAEKNKGKAGGDKPVVHAYKPEDYGLTKEEIRTEFQDYVEKYNL